MQIFIGRKLFKIWFKGILENWRIVELCCHHVRSALVQIEPFTLVESYTDRHMWIEIELWGETTDFLRSKVSQAHSVHLLIGIITDYGQQSGRQQVLNDLEQASSLNCQVRETKFSDDIHVQYRCISIGSIQRS